MTGEVFGMDCVIAHCSTPGCYMRVPVCSITPGAKLEFDPTLVVTVTCPSCGKEVKESASQLERARQEEITAKFQVGRVRAKTGGA